MSALLERPTPVAGPPPPGGAGEFKVVVTGSRGWTDGTVIRDALKAIPRRSTVIIGAAPRGADHIAEGAARVLGHRVILMHAEWDLHGKSAGHIRNARMLDERPDLVLAFWLGNSPGTRGCVAEARRRGIPIDLYWRPE